MLFNKKLILVALTLTLINCSKKADEASDSSNSLEDSAEAGLTLVQSIADDENGSSYASLSSKPTGSFQAASTFVQMLIEKAQAATCQRARLQACSAGVRATVLDNCELGQFSTNGNVSLSYSDSACSMASVGNSVTREFDYSITGPRSGVFSVNSNVADDYRGQSIGGGGRLTVTSAGWNIDVLGKHKSFTRRGRNLYNVSVRTLQPIKVTGGLARSNRVLNDGQLEVNHNLAGFTAVYTFSNVSYSASCCHPTGGQIQTTYSGSVTGSSTLSFGSCGSATLDKDGQSENITLSYCE